MIGTQTDKRTDIRTCWSASSQPKISGLSFDRIDNSSKIGAFWSDSELGPFKLKWVCALLYSAPFYVKVSNFE